MQSINPALEAEYDNRALVPEHPAIFERWRRESRVLREITPCMLDLAYGTEPRHKLDVFPAKDPRGTLVFIHGGYWRSLDKSDFSFVAKPFVDAGLSVVAINYRLCPSVHISDVVEDCRQALAWIITNGPTHDLPVERIALAGHSAGGHLVAMLYATEWHRRQCDARRDRSEQHLRQVGFRKHRCVTQAVRNRQRVSVNPSRIAGVVLSGRRSDRDLMKFFHTAIK